MNPAAGRRGPAASGEKLLDICPSTMAADFKSA
jgi:hypothetical protein